MTDLGVLVLDAANRAALASVRALVRVGCRVAVAECADSLPAASFASRHPDRRHVLPSRDADPAAFVAAVSGVLERHPADVVLPVADGTVELLRQRRVELPGRTRLALPGDVALDAAIDKTRTLAAARAVGVRVPCGLEVGDPCQAGEAAELVGFPAVVKPAASWAEDSGRVGRLACGVAFDVRGLEEMLGAMLDAGTTPIVQEWLPGRREAVHTMYADDRMWAAVAVFAHRTSPPLGGNSVFRETFPLPADLAGATERLIRRLDLDGYSEVEFRRDREGRPVLMEINPRLSASVEVAIRAGVNLPDMACRWAAGLPLQAAPEYRSGVRLRWLGGDLRWLRETRRSSGGPDVLPIGPAARRFASDFVMRSHYDYVDLRDPLPALSASAGLFGAAFRRLTRYGTSRVTTPASTPEGRCATTGEPARSDPVLREPVTPGSSRDTVASG